MRGAIVRREPERDTRLVSVVAQDLVDEGGAVGGGRGPGGRGVDEAGAVLLAVGFEADVSRGEVGAW